MNDETPSSSSARSEAAKPRWYSIKDAAEFLDVGEPTLYRWMREGKITYRKVGDSTRFWREDLDAVMEIFHSERDAATVKKLCPICRGDDLVPGAFRSTGLNYFQPQKTKFWSLKGSQIVTEALMCARCGAVHLFADVNRLRELRKTQPQGEKKEEDSKP